MNRATATRGGAAGRSTVGGLTAIAARILGRGVDPGDNFFASGGDSLRAARLIVLVGRDMGRRITMEDLVRHPVFADLADVLDDPSTPAATSRTPSSPHHEEALSEFDADLRPLSYNQRRRLSWDESQARLGVREAHHVTYTARIAGDLSPSCVDRALQAVIDRHDALRLMICRNNGAWTAAVTGGAVPRHATVVDAQGWPESAVESALRAEYERPFDLARDVKLRLLLLRHGDALWTLVFTVEHIVCDGHSMDLIVQDFSRAYRAYHAGTEPAWPSIPASFLTWAAHEAATLRGEHLERRVGYWRSHLDPLMPVPEFMVPGAVQPPVASQRAAVIRATIQEQFGRRLDSAARQTSTTPYALCAAAMLLAMQAIGGVRVPGMVSPVSLRPPRYDGTVGWFSQSMPVRVALGVHDDISSLAAGVQSALAAGADHLLPLAALVNALQPERLRTRRWRPWVFFDVHREPDKPLLDVGDASVTVLDLEGVTVRDGLGVFCTLTAHGMRLLVQYEADSLPPDRADAFVSTFVTALGEVVRDPAAELDRTLRRIGRIQNGNQPE